MTLSISATVALTCLFVPKVYIVLFQPHKNVRGHGSKGSGPGARPFFGCHQTSALNSLDVTNPSSNLHFVQWRAEAVGCPGPTRFFDALENIFYSSRKISDDLCLVVHPLFRISCQISREFAPWVPPLVLHHAPVTTFFYFLFGHLPTFF